MDGLIVLVGLAALVAFVLGPIGFFKAVAHSGRLRELERDLRETRERLKAAEQRLDAGERGEALPPPPPPLVEVAPTKAEALAVEAAEPEVLAAEPAVFPPPPPPPPPTPPPPPPKLSLEERFGARWTVWVGGLATALGALLLVRYSITAGYFGPAARITLGLILAAALLGVGERLRRGGGAFQFAQTPSAPAALTGAGVVAAFGSVYAAYALYGYIGSAFAFLALGAVALSALALAALHGPALAGLGFLGAYAAPILVSSDHPSPWPLVVYLFVVGAATYGLARLRGWLWLALAALVGGAGWMILLHIGAGETHELDTQHAAEAMLALQGALAAFFLGFEPNRGVDDANAGLDRVGTLALAGFAVLGLLALHVAPGFAAYDVVWVAMAVLFVAALAVAGVLAAPAAGLAALAGLFALGVLVVWPAADAARGLDFQGLVAHWRWPPPTDPKTFCGFAIVVGLAVAALAGWRLIVGPKLGLIPSAVYAGAAALTPLGAILIADARLADGAPSGNLAASAAVLAGLFAAASTMFPRALANTESEATKLGLGALAAAAIASLASGLVFALDGAALTVSLAAAALATAYVAIKLKIPALRCCVAGFGVAVAARLAWEPRIVGAALSPTPIFNWLLFGYGAPALAFGWAAKWLRREGEDTPVRVAEAMTVLFSAFLVFFEIRHATNGGDPFARGSGLVEQGLMAVSGFGFALVLTRLDTARANVVFRWASLIAGVLGAGAAAIGLLLRFNPLFGLESVEGGVIFNALLISYALPALLAGALWLAARRARPQPYVQVTAALAVALGFAYQVLQLRLWLHGPYLGFDAGFTISELGLDASIWLALALVWNLLGGRGKLGRRYQTALFTASAVAGVVGLAGFENPCFTNEKIAGWALINALLVAYALPGALTAVLARRLGSASMRIAAILWAFAYVTLETRRLFNDAAIGWQNGATDAEIYAYSAVWLALGLALLVWGVLRSSQEARYASAFFIVATTLKVFLYDFAGLEGALRAFSFIGLGVALIGIGLVYQKWVFGKPAPATSE